MVSVGGQVQRHHKTPTFTSVPLYNARSGYVPALKKYITMHSSLPRQRPSNLFCSTAPV